MIMQTWPQALWQCDYVSCINWAFMCCLFFSPNYPKSLSTVVGVAAEIQGEAEWKQFSKKPQWGRGIALALGICRNDPPVSQSAINVFS